MTTRITPTSQDGANGSSLERNRRLLGLIWTAISVTIFAGWFVVTRVSVTQSLNIWDITVLRFGIGAVVLAPAVLRRGNRPPARTWAKGMLFMLLWGFPFTLFIATGVRHTSAVIAASVTPPMMPVFAGLFSVLLLRERMGMLRLASYVAIVLGIVLLVFAKGITAHPDFLGIASLAAAAALWAGYTLVFRTSGVSPLQAAAMICIWSTAFLLPVYLLSGFSNFHVATAREIAMQAFYQGVLMSSVALVTYSRGVALLGASTAAAVIAFLPAVASAIAIPVLGEIPNSVSALAIAVIVIGALAGARSTVNLTANVGRSTPVLER